MELEVKSKARPVFVEIDHRDHEAYALGNDRCQGRTGSAHMKSCYEYHIQHQIDCGCNGNK